MAYIIGITGGSASGKTTFIRQLQQAFDATQLTVLSQDHYYKPLQMQEKDENGEINFDLPESIFMHKFMDDIEKLVAGEELLISEYTFNIGTKEPQTLCIKPAQVIVVEGIFLFGEKAISDKLNLKIFIDATEEIKYQRRLSRDANERELSEKVIDYQWHHHVKPAFEKHIFPYKKEADIVILNDTGFKDELNELVKYINEMLENYIDSNEAHRI